jgi:hypothetical protein
MGDFIAFAPILICPYRAKVLPVEADFNLLTISQIECAAWHDVVDVPPASILPCHAFGELAFDMLPKLQWSASSHLVPTD